MSIRKITRLPENDKTNGWSRLLSPRTPKPSLAKDIQADWVIVGGGLAGLAAARRLAENRPGDSIVVLEADQVGEGAQGRNSGFAIDSPHNVGSSMGELDAARSHLRLARTAIAYLKTQVERYGIECDWSPIGKFHAAVSPEGVEKTLKPTRQVLDSLQEPYEWLDGKALHDKLGFKHFRTGIYTPGTVLLNPAGLSRGLADNMPANVTIHEKTPVLSVQQGDGVTLETPGGKVRAGKMILAVNVFAEQFGFYSGKLMPMAAHASLTRCLTESEQRELGGLPSWGLTPANAFVGITMRRTNDQRILIRQHMTYAPNLRSDDESRRRVRIEHKTLFDERFPNLKNVEMEHTWTGFICLSRNGSPGFGQVAPHVYSAVCQNGVGLTKGTISGMLVADLACAVDNPLIANMQALGQPDALPPRPFLDVGVRARLGWELWRHRAEA